MADSQGFAVLEIPDTARGRESAAALARKMADMNRGKTVPKIPRAILRESEDTKVFIFNVGTRRQDIGMINGSAWNFVGPCLNREGLEAHINALDPEFRDPERARYVEIAPGKFSRPFEEPGIPWQPYWKEGSVASILFEGEEDAEDTGLTTALYGIGVGKNMKRTKSLEKFGCFVSKHNPPLASEVEAAQKAWLKNCRNECNEANEAHKVGKFLGEKGIAQPFHYEAARILIAAGTARASDFAWLDAVAEISTLPEACPYCGSSMNAGLSTCPNCKAVTNYLAYYASVVKAGGRLTQDQKDHFEELKLEAATAPEAKPKKK
jgi:hypothetical protein